MHDYIVLDNDWYKGFLQFGNDFEVCVNKIFNKNGTRFRDYVLGIVLLEHESDYYNNCLLPYDFINNEITNKYLYISGGYYVIKKEIGLKYKLNEDLCWGDGEDYELCLRFHRDNVIIKCNKYSSVRFLKQKSQSDNFDRELPVNLANDLNKNNIVPNVAKLKSILNEYLLKNKIKYNN
jgi:hypothetical protein